MNCPVMVKVGQPTQHMITSEGRSIAGAKMRLDQAIIAACNRFEREAGVLIDEVRYKPCEYRQRQVGV